MQFLSGSLVCCFPRVRSEDSHDAKCKRRLEHSALSVDVEAVAIARDVEKAQISAIRAIRRPVGAVRIGNATKNVDTADECANKEKVDEGYEFGRVSCPRVQEQRSQRPCRSQHRHYEEHQNRSRRKQIAVIVPRDKPGEHAQCRNQRDDLEDAPENE